jgi:anionic cell wall polymer biosynthesis LytR-Cps2A-Psr (LCP) family protein
MNLLLSYAVDVDTEAQRAENTSKSVSHILYGVPLKYYVAFDESALADASTAVGGVELEALESIPGAQYEKGDTVLLKGEDALNYVQYRDMGEDDSASDLQQRQVQYFQSFKKAGSKDALGVFNLYNSLAGELTTNLGMAEVLYLASLHPGDKDEGLEVVQLKGKAKEFPDEDGDVHEHVLLNKDDVTEAMLDTFYTQVD